MKSTRIKGNMTRFPDLDMRRYTDEEGVTFFFYKIDGAYFAFEQVVAKQAIGHALGMTESEITATNAVIIGNRFWNGGNASGKVGRPRKSEAAHAAH